MKVSMKLDVPLTMYNIHEYIMPLYENKLLMKMKIDIMKISIRLLCSVPQTHASRMINNII